MFDFVVVVNDNGEFKTISSTEVKKAIKSQYEITDAVLEIDDLFNDILDKREEPVADE